MGNTNMRSTSQLTHDPTGAPPKRRLRPGFVDPCARRGPLTAAGKARAAQNARRHGLSIPVSCDPPATAEIEALAQNICRSCAAARPDSTDAASRECLRLARRIAEAQIDLRRVRGARHALIGRAYANPRWRPAKGLHAWIRFLGKVGELQRRGIPLPPDMRDAILVRPQGVDKFARILADEVTALARMDRYERRALARRKRAIRAFDAAMTERARREAELAESGTHPDPLHSPSKTGIDALMAKSGAREQQAHPGPDGAAATPPSAAILAKRNTPKNVRTISGMPATAGNPTDLTLRRRQRVGPPAGPMTGSAPSRRVDQRHVRAATLRDASLRDAPQGEVRGCSQRVSKRGRPNFLAKRNTPKRSHPINDLRVPPKRPPPSPRLPAIQQPELLLGAPRHLRARRIAGRKESHEPAMNWIDSLGSVRVSIAHSR